ncbi:MAG: cytochrome c3 family protein [Lentisphaeraceae bacterium]|nr:cytochrome c3 family protein [Lentisphaeraceae bacterium]
MARFLKFGLKESTYQRPTQKWVCGKTCEGRACTLGPTSKGECVATAQCMPEKKKDRWHCTRSELAGGECETGPSPTGECCKKIETCTPVLNTRFNRGRFVAGICTVGLSFLLVVLFGPFNDKMVTPGPLTEGHRSMERNCSACHSAVESGMLSKVINLHKGFDDNSKCLHCHKLGENSSNTHNLASLKGAPETHSCTDCHKEHKGDKSTLINTNSCISCHKNAMQDGHSNFSKFPFKRRTRMTFDHKSHFTKFFKEKGGFAPEKCSACHILSPTGKTMLVKSFSVSCSACHENQIVREDKKYTFLSLPLLDVESLDGIGQWPEDAEGRITPFMKLLLSKDADFNKSYEAVKDLDWGDLTDATDEQKKHVSTVAWKVKDLVFNLANKNDYLKTQLSSTMGPGEEGAEIAKFDIPGNMVKKSAKAWFPSLKTEIRAYRSGDLSKLKSAVETPKKEEPKKAAEKVKVNKDGEIDIGDDGEIKIGDDGEIDIGDDGEIKIGDDGEIDIGDDGEIKIDDAEIKIDDGEIKFDDDAEIKIDDGEIDIGDGEIKFDDEPEEEVVQDADVNVELVKEGQWEMEYFTLTYTPESHADKVLRFWLKNSIDKKHQALKEIFDSLKDPVKSPGLCLKCHSVDEVDGKQSINWHAKRPHSNKKTFTEFDHSSHTEGVVKEGCVSCHQIDDKADYMKAFKQLNPFEFSSNFKSINKGKCFDCHSNNSMDGTQASCVECHNYHVGTFEKTIISSSISEVLEKEDKDKKEEEGKSEEK